MKIMFICTSNVCRSIIAEAFLKEKIQKDAKLKEKIQVYSAGVFAQDGDEPLYNAVEAMKEYKIDITTYKSTSLKKSNIKEMDLILCAQQTHKNVLLNICPELKNKIYTLKEYINEEDKNLDIIEPKGYDIEIYRTCTSEIETLVEKLIEKLKRSEE